MAKNRARKKAVRAEQARTGKAYNVARQALDDDKIQQLADEAEEGYDPSKLVPRNNMPL